jgi:hypothetical protein
VEYHGCTVVLVMVKEATRRMLANSDKVGEVAPGASKRDEGVKAML